MRTLADRSTDQFVFNALLRQWPLDVDVAWTAWEHCLPTQACDRALRARHLVKVDGRNGVAWLALMDTLWRLQDEAGMDNALARAAKAPEFELRRGSTYVRVYPVFAALAPSQSCWQEIAPTLHEILGMAPTPLDMADLEAQGTEMATTTPGASLPEACGNREGHRLAPSRRKDCIAVLTHLSDQPTLGDQLSGLRLLIPLLGDDAAALKRREQYRQMRWFLLNVGKVRFPPGSGASIWSQGQIPYFKTLLREQSLWPPPPDWLPPDERSRLLVLEGR